MTYCNPTGLISVTEVFSPYISWDHISPEVLRRASERGNRVHDVIADCMGDGFPIIDDEIRGYFEAAMKFLERVEEISLCEVRLISTAHAYTGQVDLVCRIKGDECLTLVDWKTSSVTSKSWPLQIAGYRALVHQSGSGLSIGRGMCVQLKKDGTYKINEYPNSQRDFSLFLNCLTAWRYFNPPKIDINWDFL